VSQDDLASLAESIKTVGLINPIVLGKWKEGDETVEGIVAGRNRLADCKLAGIEPQFTKLNGQDIKAFVVAENLERRDMTASQKAMALAMMYKEPEATAPGKKSKAATLSAAQSVSAERLRGFSTRLEVFAD
jgi:ParB-like chromosome segregation protein Spo0J